MSPLSCGSRLFHTASGAEVGLLSGVRSAALDATTAAAAAAAAGKHLAQTTGDAQ